MLNKYLLINWYHWKSRQNKERTEENHAVSLLMPKKKPADACLVTPQRKLMFKENKKMETSKKYQVPSLAKCTSLIMLLGDIATLGLQRNRGNTTGTSQSDLVVVYSWPIRLDYLKACSNISQSYVCIFPISGLTYPLSITFEKFFEVDNPRNFF